MLFEDIIKSYSKSFDFESLNFGERGDEIDNATRERNNLLELKLKGREKFFLKKVFRAIEKIETGCFGECEECGDEIGERRLKARPTAELCISCKEEAEKTENQVLYFKKSHTLGKSIKNDKVVPIFSTEQS